MGIVSDGGHCTVSYKYSNVYNKRCEYQHNTSCNLETWVAIGTAAVLNFVVARFYM